MDKPIWNEPATLLRLGNDRDLLNDLIGFYLEDSVDLRIAFDTAIAASDFSEAHRAMHAIKGLCANFDAETAVSIARQIETAVAAGEPDMEDLSHLDTELSLLKEELLRWRMKQA